MRENVGRVERNKIPPRQCCRRAIELLVLGAQKLFDSNPWRVMTPLGGLDARLAQYLPYVENGHMYV